MAARKTPKKPAALAPMPRGGAMPMPTAAHMPKMPKSPKMPAHPGNPKR